MVESRSLNGPLINAITDLPQRDCKDTFCGTQSSLRLPFLSSELWHTRFRYHQVATCRAGVQAGAGRSASALRRRHRAWEWRRLRTGCAVCRSEHRANCSKWSLVIANWFLLNKLLPHLGTDCWRNLSMFVMKSYLISSWAKRPLLLLLLPPLKFRQF